MCPKSRGRVCSFGTSLRVRVVFLGSRLRNKVSHLLTQVPNSGCVSFVGLGLGAKQFRLCVVAIDQGFSGA